MLQFELIGDVSGREVIAKGSGIRDLARLRGLYGAGAKWRKCKGRSKVEMKVKKVL